MIKKLNININSHFYIVPNIFKIKKLTKILTADLVISTYNPFCYFIVTENLMNHCFFFLTNCLVFVYCRVAHTTGI